MPSHTTPPTPWSHSIALPLIYVLQASCYAQNTTLPTTSCKAVELAGLTPAGTSATGETGKKYAKVSANVTGLRTFPAVWYPSAICTLLTMSSLLPNSRQ